MASTSNAGINPIAPAAADRGRCRLCCRNVGGGGVGRDGRVGLLRTVRGMKLTWWTVRGMNMNLRKGGPAIGEEAGTVRAGGTFQDTMGEVSGLEDRDGARVVSNTRYPDTHQQTHTRHMRTSTSRHAVVWPGQAQVAATPPHPHPARTHTRLTKVSMLRLEALILDRVHIGDHVYIMLQITHWRMQPTSGKTHTLV